MAEPTPDNLHLLGTTIVSRPGIMQQSLRSSLAGCPGIKVLASLGDGLTALNHVAAHPPALLIVDCNLLDEEVEALLAGVRERHLPTQCLVLTRTAGRTAWALGAGAEAAIPRDASHEELLAALARFRTDQA